MSTNRELQTLSEFKLKTEDVSNELSEYFRSDTMMLTWLKARDFNISKAEEMLRKSIEWRKSNDFSTLSSWNPPQKFTEEFYYEVTGFTRQQYPIVVVPFGNWNLRKAVENGDKDLWLKYINKIFSSIVSIVESKSQLPDNVVSQFCIIVDMDGFSMKQIRAVECVDAVLEAARRFEANFPETLCMAHVVNAPRIFSLLFALIKPILSAHTQSKIQIHGYNSKKWIPALLKTLPGDQLPEKYGGSLKNSSLMSARIQDSVTTDVEDSEFVAVTVAAGTKLSVDFDIKTAGATLSWSFKTKSYDIGFSVVYEENDEVHPYGKYDNKQEGSLVCKLPGKYSLLFDNTYSLLRSKCLNYIASSSDENDDFNDAEVEDTHL